MNGFIIFRLKYFYNRVIIALFVSEKNQIKIFQAMKQVLKYIGVIVLLIGVFILAIPTLQGSVSNTVLLVGIGTMLIGYFGHIVINKKLEK